MCDLFTRHSLGAFINGFEVSGNSYAGGVFGWLTPFSIFTGFGLLVAYALLGCTWLIMKTEGTLQQRMIALARPATLGLLAAIGVVSLWTPLIHPAIAARWFALPDFFAPVPLLVPRPQERSACLETRDTRSSLFLRYSCCSWLQRSRDQPLAPGPTGI